MNDQTTVPNCTIETSNVTADQSSNPTNTDPVAAAIAVDSDLETRTALETEIAKLTEAPTLRDRTALLAWLKQQSHHASQWVKHRPWLGLPFLTVFPVIAWSLEQHRPPAPAMPTAIEQSQVVTRSALTSTTPQPQVSSPVPAATPSLQPVDLNQLTPEQKAMNAKAKSAILGAAALVDSHIEMQVAIATQAPAVAIGGASPVEVTDAKGKVLYQLAANEIYTAQPDSQGLTIGNQPLPATIYLNAPQTGIIIISGRPYRGRLRLSAEAGRLWAVNHVNMRNYLQSVVASEVSPNWGPEALKAQAIAARSYALTYYFKPAHKLYHLGNDEYYQVYSGIEREAPETNAAVDQTSGEFVSYKGGIVESLYAASDAIVMEAFQGKGMSQLGAKALATQGFNYEQILSNYYPGTAVGKIVQEF